jgi:glucokinase
MYLAIEIGGTKLQLCVGPATGGPLAVLERIAVDPDRGADGIRDQIARVAPPLIARHAVVRVGVGFGGPVDAAAGRTIRSFQIEGWEGFPLREWCQNVFGVPVVIENDSNLAGLGEARCGAGRGARIVFYSNVGSGIGGALVIDGSLYPGGTGTAVAEIGHLRPGPQAVDAADTVESIASGWGIAAAAARRCADVDAARRDGDAVQLLAVSGNASLSGKKVLDAAADGNSLALEIVGTAIRTYGWALAQAITLIAPNVVVVGGGVAQVGEQLFFAPLRQEVARYVFPPLRGTYRLVPAALGEEVVLHGALALAADGGPAPSRPHDDA